MLTALLFVVAGLNPVPKPVMGAHLARFCIVSGQLPLAAFLLQDVGDREWLLRSSYVLNRN